MPGPLTGIQVVELDLTTGDGLRVALEFSPTPTDDQFHAAGGVVYVPDGESTQPMVATPADFGGTPWEPRPVAPALGEHTEEILAELAQRRAD